MPTKTETIIDRRNLQSWADPRTISELRSLTTYTDPGEQVCLNRLTPGALGVPILDLGVGTGRTIAMLLALSPDYVGIDYTAAMVDACRAAHPSTEVRLGDARDLQDFPTDHFGLVVFSFNGIDAVAHGDRSAIFAEVRRVLRPGGVFWFSTHNLSGPGPKERPWRLPRAIVRHPRWAARTAVRMPRRLVNYRRNSALRDQGDGWEFRVAGAHDFGIVIHYTSLAAGLAEVQAAGFAPDPEAYDSVTGARVHVGDDTTSAWWYHVVARKTGGGIGRVATAEALVAAR